MTRAFFMADTVLLLIRHWFSDTPFRCTLIPEDALLILTDTGTYAHKKSVLWVRIRMDPELLPAKNTTVNSGLFVLLDSSIEKRMANSC